MRELAGFLVIAVTSAVAPAAVAGGNVGECSGAPSPWVAAAEADFVIHVDANRAAYRICRSNYYGYADNFTVYANADNGAVALPYKLKGPPEYACADVIGKIVFVSTDRSSHKIDGWYCPLN